MNTSLQSSTCFEKVVVIPAYQPEDCLIPLAHRVQESGFQVIVVDDGSDGSFDSVWEHLDPGIIVIHHIRNFGKGAALKTAFQYILENAPAVNCIVTMDADGQHLPADMAQVADYSWMHPGTLVLGSRTFDRNTPPRSRCGNKIMSLIFSAISGTRIRDTQTGLRAFDRNLLEYMINTEGDRYEYEMNVLLHCRECRIPIAEVPIQTIYHDKNNSCSHFNGLRDSFRICGNVLKFAASSILSFCADYLAFLLLTLLLPAQTGFLILSNVLARLGSAALNYTLNAKAVFHDQRPVRKSLPPYAALALTILAADSLLLTFFVKLLGIPAMPAKLLTEGLLFLLSYTVQSKLIFRHSFGKKGGFCHASFTAQRKTA